MNEFNNLSDMVLGNYRVKLSPGKTRLQYLPLELFTSSESLQRFNYIKRHVHAYCFIKMSMDTKLITGFHLEIQSRKSSFLTYTHCHKFN